MNTAVWLVILIVCIVVEAATWGVVSVWFAFGAGAAFIAGYLGAPAAVQWTVFAAVSLFSLLITRPIVRKVMRFRITPTNQELDIGKTAVVTETVNNNENCGRVSLNGVEWSARSGNGDVLEIGSSVTVIDMAATTLTVIKNDLKTREINDVDAYSSGIETHQE